MNILLKLLACIGQTFVVFLIISGVRVALGNAVNPIMNIVLLLAAFLDLTYVNVVVWRSIKKRKPEDKVA